MQSVVVAPKQELIHWNEVASVLSSSPSSLIRAEKKSKTTSILLWHTYLGANLEGSEKKMERTPFLSLYKFRVQTTLGELNDMGRIVSLTPFP